MRKILIVILFCSGLITGCAGFKANLGMDRNPNDLKKSPCSCDPIPEALQEINNHGYS